MDRMSPAGSTRIKIFVQNRMLPKWEATLNYDSEKEMWKNLKSVINHNKDIGSHLDIKYDGDWWYIEKNVHGEFIVGHGSVRYYLTALGTLKWDPNSKREHLYNRTEKSAKKNPKRLMKW